MTNLTKAFVGTAAAAAMAVSATPAMADRGDKHRGHHKDKVTAGEVIAGAVILGGIAAILTSKKKDRYNDRYYRGHRGDYHRGDRNRGYKRGYGQRAAVNKCIRRVERQTGRYGYSNVTQIRDIDRTRYGYKIKGRVVVQDGYRDGRYNRGYRGNNRHYGGSYDKGKFSCYVERGRVVDINYRGLRGF